MNKKGAYLAGLVSALAIWGGSHLFSLTANPYGKISYTEGVTELSRDGTAQIQKIDKEGKELPYGLYRLSLRNGETLVIRKNNRGNAEVFESKDLVIVRTDENVIDVRYEKK